MIMQPVPTLMVPLLVNVKMAFWGMELCIKVMHKKFGVEVFGFVLYDDT